MSPMATESPSSDTPTPTATAPAAGVAAAAAAVTPPSPTNTKSNADKPPEPPDSAPPPVVAADSGSRGSTPPPPPADSSSSSPPPHPLPAATEDTTSASAEEAPKSSSPKPLTISIPVATSPTFFSYAGATVAGGDSRTFSQLLAGAMASSPLVASSPLANRPGTPVLAVPMVAVPCFLAPAGLLDSCGITGQFAMSHQAVLATVTAQAQMQLHAGFSSPTHQNHFPLSPMPLQQKSPQKSEVNHTSQETADEKQRQGVDIVVKSVSNDGYNWRKYGQKQVKSSDSSRSYYRCTQANCSAKKKVQRSSDGHVTEVEYQCEHNHEPPQKGKYTKERDIQSIGVSRESDKSETQAANSNQVETSSKAEKKSLDTAPEQLHCSSDCEGDTASKIEDHDEPDPKRRLSENPMTPMTPVFRTVREQKVIIEKGCNGGLPSDGFRWRKYGQKIVKGNPNPRSYYKCTHLGCPVRKHVERHSEDAKMVVITYEGNHIHDSPLYRVGSESPVTPARLCVSASVASEEKKLECNSALDKKPPLDCQSKSDAELPDEKSNILGEAAVKDSEEPKAMEINLSPGVGSVEAPDFINQPILDESKAVVAVNNA